MRAANLSVAVAGVCFLCLTARPAAAADFPTKGTWSIEAGGATWKVTFMESGKLTVNRNGQLAVEATYKVDKDEVAFTDVKGPNADPNSGPGKYRWKLDGKKLSFTKIEDKNEGRASVVTAGDWMKQD